MTEEMKSAMNMVCKIMDYGAYRGGDVGNHRIADIARHFFIWHVE